VVLIANILKGVRARIISLNMIFLKPYKLPPR
jgi:hypothetical protein